MGRADRAMWAAMESRCIMQLRNMNAQVYAEKNMEIKIGEEIIPVEKCLVFQSYESVCAVYDGGTMILYIFSLATTTAERRPVNSRLFSRTFVTTPTTRRLSTCASGSRTRARIPSSMPMGIDSARAMESFSLIRLRSIPTHVARSGQILQRAAEWEGGALWLS